MGIRHFLSDIIYHFQSIFEWSKIPMDFIDASFASLSTLAAENLPAGVLTNLISQGIIPGLVEF
jgi:ferrous iron transport protein B